MQAVNGSSDPSTFPLKVPAGHVGPVVLPGSNRQVWWTGRIAIGLRYERRDNLVVGDSASWVQRMLLASQASRAVRANKAGRSNRTDRSDTVHVGAAA